MDSVSIIDASSNDVTSIIELLYDLGRPKPQKASDIDAFRKLVKNYITDPNTKILVAKLDDVKVVGMASLVFLPRLNRATMELYIPELIVLEECQNRGIGRKLMNSCIAIAKEEKCHRLRLESGNQRKESHKFYKNLGFEQSSLSFTKNLN